MAHCKKRLVGVCTDGIGLRELHIIVGSKYHMISYYPFQNKYMLESHINSLDLDRLDIYEIDRWIPFMLQLIGGQLVSVLARSDMLIKTI